jgi:hypothetical protein
MGRYTQSYGDFWQYAMYLIFDKSGDVRLTRGYPELKPSERAISLTVDLPKAMFTVPSLRAQITIEPPTAHPPQIDVKAAQEALAGALGANVSITVEDAK